MPITSGFSGFPHFTQRLLLTTSTYSFYFIFFYAKREIIFRKRTHGVWKRWVQICFYFLLNYKKKVVILFWYFSSVKSTIKEKFLHVSSRVVEGADPCLGDADTHAPHMCQFPYKIKPKYSQQTKQKIKVHSAFSFDEEGAKEKATKKKTPKEDFALCGARQRLRAPRLGDADTHAPRMCQFPPLSVDDTAFPKRRAKTSIAPVRKLYFSAAKIKLKHKAF